MAQGGRSFGYGLTADSPVVGDWDGNNGTDTAGVVRGWSFCLRNRAGGGKVSAVVPFAG